MFKRYVHVEGLTSLVGSDGQYLISIIGRVIDRYGSAVEVSKDGEGHLQVYVLSWDGERYYRIIDLVALHFKGLRIPPEDYGRVAAFVLDGDKGNVHAQNVGYRFLGGPLEVRDQPGFYYVPGYTLYAINKDGVLINTERKTEKKWWTTKPQVYKNITGGYRVCRVAFDKETAVALYRHRALCLVFKDYPDNIDSLTVNHDNGTPGDDRLDNLSWTTKLVNNVHAFETGLRSQNTPVLVRDVRTGVVVRYYSVAVCAKELGYPTDETIGRRLRHSKFGKVFRDGKQFKLESDPRDWIIPSDPEAEIKKARIGKKTWVRNCITLEETLYDSVSDAAEACGVNASTLEFQFKIGIRRPYFGYQFKLEDDLRPWPEFTDKELELSYKSNSEAVSVRNLLTGVELEFDSMRKACDHIGVHNSHVSSILRKKEQYLNSEGWQLKYSTDSWHEFDNPEEEVYKRTRDIAAREEASGKMILASDAAQMSAILKLDPKAIRVAALTRGQKVYHGYRFRLGVSSTPWPEVAST